LYFDLTISFLADRT